MALDERMRRELERAGRPADPTGVYEELIRRRERRRLVRRGQQTVLAIVVVTGVIGGALAVSRVFQQDEQLATRGDIGNGLITFVGHEPVEREDGFPAMSSTIWVMNLDGSGARQLLTTQGTIRGLEWAPDGTKLAFDADWGIQVVNADGTGHIRLTALDPERGASMPTWSPDGGKIAFAFDDGQETEIAVMSADGTNRTTLTNLGEAAWPDWSPDGREILFVSRGPEGNRQGWDIYVMNADGSNVRNLTNSPTVDLAPVWSPDGTQILFRSRRDIVRQGPSDQPDEIYVMNADGSIAMRLTDDLNIDQSPIWSPDGRFVAFTSIDEEAETTGLVVMNPDGSGRRVAVEELAGVTIAWQPIPPGDAELPSPSPTEPSPSPTDEPLPEGVEDIGVGFPVCFAERLTGIDYLGDGTDGTGWTAVPAKDDGSCPRYPHPAKFILAVDHTGDRFADSWIDLPPVCYNGCAPWDATDLDANGTDELIVTSFFSIQDHYLFAVRPDTSGELRVEPILVADPGHGPAGINAGEPLRIDAGGDAGYGSAIQCEGYPSAPVIVWSWAFAPIESDDPTEVHVTRLELRSDGMFHVVGTNDFTVPAGTPSGIELQTELGRQCGVDWYR